ncbi:hypothetical protein LTR10_015281 [Elasticomyces elasticus]|uniref:F-box domain-containing protein n=1 Tax=Exophiala sideris TaxID=1016849 RepID=A0ABR0JIY1_9EURO|nr:hypothetical protein LTR10_015281 [Elasticomyces elasticus]KAK5030319.1 hypothetical protein LTR13_008338 [Exophiala sideris]KAK5035026.1 hypothetical protein LTS07_002461 [Exophiala sideris]KAK5065949.1 hypothetical protein LTR69_002466 [Exophiala sideris]KAK5178384.1 hypothetical protein LTR44_009260 [Eurotiomycetes sp. CCFEE 6388]
MDESASALEQFRQQWKEEVTARSKRSDNKLSEPRQPDRTRRPSEARLERPINKPPTRHPISDIKDDSDHHSDPDHGSERPQGASSNLAQQVEALSIQNVDDDEFAPKPSIKEPKSALEHFEHAVERERQGQLGDSVSHYRKAYRLDAKVDQSYRHKHFPTKPKPTDPNPSGAPVTVPSTAHHSSKEPTEQLTIDELIDSLAESQIPGAPPIIEGEQPPPCSIKKLPTEVLLELLRHVAIRDPAVFVRLSLVCKKLAYHVFTDNNTWKRVAMGREFGLAAQQYNFVTDLQGRELIFREIGDEDDEDLAPSRVGESAFPKEVIWRDVFHSYPRIRFTGVYISTVNYTRPGGASASAFTWSNPIHVVTYYRYLRFFRDGTCISLLTTDEPIDVVHHLTPENLSYVRGGKKEAASLLKSTSAIAKQSGTGPKAAASATSTGVAPPPAAQHVMKQALRGRWRLCHPSLEPAVAETTPIDQPNPTAISPGDLHIETEGAGPRYMYTMHLSLKNAGSARSKHTTKNNKLQWKGFWSYNMLTNDWAEFSLRHDKPFHFSRVKGYGLGY